MRSILEAVLNGPRPAHVAAEPAGHPGQEVAKPVNRHGVRDTRSGRFTVKQVIRVRKGKVQR